MIFAALAEAASRGELLLVESGLCRFHRRKDGVVVIRELVVLPEARRRGTGRALVERVASRFPGSPIEARCPTALEANSFWPAVGFTLLWRLAEKPVNVWRRNPS